MFLLDSLMISGIQWAIKTVITAAEAEMNDDSALRDQLLAAEMQREMGEISDEDFREIEADLLARIREIKQRREGHGPLGFGGAEPMETSPDSRFQVEASVSGDFYDPADAPHTTVVDTAPSVVQETHVLDIEPGDPDPVIPVPRPAAPRRTARTARTTRTARTARTARTTRTARTARTARTKKKP
jgi:hypothetical protein